MPTPNVTWKSDQLVVQSVETAANHVRDNKCKQGKKTDAHVFLEPEFRFGKRFHLFVRGVFAFNVRWLFM